MIIAGTDDSVTDLHLENLLENVFNTLVLNVGLSEIINTKNIDILKKEFRVRAFNIKVSIKAVMAVLHFLLNDI